MRWDKSIAMFRAYLFFDDNDMRITDWMRKHSEWMLRYALAIIFIWFGVLKILGSSPVTELVAHTVYWADPRWFVPLLGWWEVIIGLCFLYKPLVRLGILLLAPQMIGTFLPLVLLPAVVFTNGNAFFPTLEGSYIIKNLVIIAAAIAIGAHARDTTQK